MNTHALAAQELELGTNDFVSADLNKLSALPSSLHKLNLGHCGLRAVPPVLTALTRLQIL